MEIAHGPDDMQPDGLMHNGTSPAIQVRRMGAEDIESCHQGTCLCHMQTTKMQISLCIHAI